MSTNAIFTKVGAANSPLTLPKGRFYPVNEPLSPRQIIGKTGGGQVKIADVGDPEQFFPIVINRVSKTFRDNLLAFLADSLVNYSQNTFTFTDEESTAYTVRLWSTRTIDFPAVKGSLYNIRLVLRKEIT